MSSNMGRTMNSRYNVTKKSPLLDSSTILIFALLFFVLLMVLFPRSLFLNNLVSNQTPSNISTSYLRNLIEEYPSNVAMKLGLAEQEIKLGNMTEANTLIAPYITLTPTSKIQWKVLFLHYQVIRIGAFSLGEKNPKRIHDEELLKQLLPILVNSPWLTADETAILAKDSLAFNQPRLAVAFYKLTINKQGKQSSTFFSEAGRAALYIGDYESSAMFYLLAMHNSTQRAVRRICYFKAIDSLKLSGKVGRALDVAQHSIDGLMNDKKTLILLTQLANEAGENKVAEQYVKRIVQLRYKEWV